MNRTEQLLLIVGGFAASVCMGLAMERSRPRTALSIVAALSGFHILMFSLGYAFGACCAAWIAALGPLAAGLILTLLGAALVALVMSVLAGIGVCSGRAIGAGLRQKAELAGGLILCLLGLKNLFGLL